MVALTSSLYRRLVAFQGLSHPWDHGHDDHGDGHGHEEGASHDGGPAVWSKEGVGARPRLVGAGAEEDDE